MISKTTFISDISQKEFPIADKIAAKTIRNPILALIQTDYPDFDEEKSLSIGELNMYRERYISNYLFIGRNRGVVKSGNQSYRFLERG